MEYDEYFIQLGLRLNEIEERLKRLEDKK